MISFQIYTFIIQWILDIGSIDQVVVGLLQFLAACDLRVNRALANFYYKGLKS